jgi:RNA polymerase sigma-70 factor (ECF subfamily)
MTAAADENSADFEAFVRAFQDMVYATALRLLGNPAEAEDVAQTVFLRAYQRFATIGGSPAAGGWLKKVTINLCINHLARYRRRWQLFSEIEPAHKQSSGVSHQMETLAIAPGSPATDLEQREVARRIEEALAALPDHQRVPIVLFHFDGMSYSEIAGLLGVSVGKVKTDIHRGRETLRHTLHDIH